MSDKRRLAVIGAGRAGGALALALRRAGYPVVAAYSRTAASAVSLCAATGGVPAGSPGAAARQADLILIAVPDGAIGPVAQAIADEGGWHAGQVTLHTSGATGAEVLAPAAALGAAVGSWHPLQTLADPAEAAGRLRGARFAVEGDPAAVTAGQELTKALGGVALTLAPGAKPLYHAGAVFASNYVVAVVAAAVRAWELAGIPAAEALPALRPLLAGTLANLEQLGLPGALTGPIDRGDSGTVARHLGALSRDPELLSLYTSLARRTLALAEAKGLDPPQAEAIRQLLPAEPKYQGPHPPAPE